MEEQAKQTVTIDGNVYEMDALTPQVRNMIALYQRWTTQAQELQSEFTKTDLAVKALGAEIGKAVAAKPDSESAAQPT